MLDLLVRGGDVVDGSGAPARRADVLVRGDRIAAVLDGGCSGEPRAGTVVDATGCVVAPGFVDIHTHSDLTLLSAPTAPSAVRQGVTTVVVGNCGLGTFPVTGGARDLARVRSAVAYLDVDPGVQWSWRDFDGYAAAVSAAQPSVGVGVLVGHLPLHAAVVGYDDRDPSASELAAMGALLDEQLAAGASGLSTGLAYAPLTTVRERELLMLGHVVAAHDGLFAWHLRDYGDELLDAVGQALRVARETRCRTQLSHLVSVGPRNRGRVRRALDLVDAALADGVDVGVDVYPYVFGNCPLSQLLPAWAQEGGAERMRVVVADAAARARIRAEWVDRPIGWDEISLSRVPGTDPRRLGRTVSAVASAQGRDADDVALDLLASHGNDVIITAGGRAESDVRAVLAHPSGVVASDGQALDPAGPTGRGMPHPRSYGCFPRVFGDYVADGGLTLAEAVRKCTSAPAARLGYRDRGLLRAGLRADITVFDPRGIRDCAGYQDPHRFPAGISDVIVAGTPVVRAGEHTGAGPGEVASPHRPADGRDPMTHGRSTT